MGDVKLLKCIPQSPQQSSISIMWHFAQSEDYLTLYWISAFL